MNVVGPLFSQKKCLSNLLLKKQSFKHLWFQYPECVFTTREPSEPYLCFCSNSFYDSVNMISQLPLGVINHWRDILMTINIIVCTDHLLNVLESEFTYCLSILSSSWSKGQIHVLHNHVNLFLTRVALLNVRKKHKRKLGVSIESTTNWNFI